MGTVIDATEKFQERYVAGAVARRQRVVQAVADLVKSRPHMKEGVVALIRQEQERRRKP